MRSIFWFRNDLRLEDNTALFHALNECSEVIPVFIISSTFINSPEISTSRVQFLLDSLTNLNSKLEKYNSNLIVRMGKPEEELMSLARETNCKGIYFNKNYDYKEVLLEKTIIGNFAKVGYRVKTFKDSVIFEEKELPLKTRKGIIAFDKFKKKWLKKFSKEDNLKLNLINDKNKQKFIGNNWELYNIGKLKSENFGFEEFNCIFLGGEDNANITLKEFFSEKETDLYINTISKILVYLRFGNLSVRKLLSQLNFEQPSLAESKIINEIIKNDYYSQFYDAEDNYISFDDKEVDWNDMSYFLVLCSANSGLPIIDAIINKIDNQAMIESDFKKILVDFVVNDLQVDIKWISRFLSYKLLDGDSVQSKIELENYEIPKNFDLIEASEKIDPQGVFIKNFLPVLKNVPESFIHEPYKMPVSLQNKVNCIIGKTYPYPILKDLFLKPDSINLSKPTN